MNSKEEVAKYQFEFRYILTFISTSNIDSYLNIFNILALFFNH